MIGRLEANTNAGGDIGRSSAMDHSKTLDLWFLELYWSNFLDPIQKKLLQKQKCWKKRFVIYECFRIPTVTAPSHGLNQHSPSSEPGGNVGTVIHYYEIKGHRGPAHKEIPISV